MTNHTINPDDYSEDLRKLLTTDPAHADTFNPLFERLINNDAFQKALVERLIQEHDHSGDDGKGSKIPFTNIDLPTDEAGLVTGKDMAYHINERNPHGTRPSDIGAPTQQNFDMLQQEVTQHSDDDATLLKKGHVQLSSAVTSVDETKAATPKAVKTVMDRADEAFTSASNGKSAVGTAITGVDDAVIIPPEPTFNDLATAIWQISTGKKWASGFATSVFEYNDGRTGATLTVSGLGFKPSIIVGLPVVSKNNLYSGHFGLIYHISLFAPNLAHKAENYIGGGADAPRAYNIGDYSVNTRTYIDNDGFCLMAMSNGSVAVDYQWVAIE